MAAIKQADKKTAIQNFTKDLYDYVWSEQILQCEKSKKQVAERLRKKIEDSNRKGISFYTVNIGKAVAVTMFLLRDHFDHIYLFTFPDTFKEDIKLMWSHWIETRDDIFVKVIDTLAIVAEAFMHCDNHNKSGPNLDEIDEMFLELFDEHLAEEFFRKGGWRQLDKVCAEWYVDLFQNFKDTTLLKVSLTSWKVTYGCCNLVNFLRNSVVSFPVADSLFCKDCRKPSDDAHYRKVVYVRTKEEIIRAYENSPNSDEDGILSKSVISCLFEKDSSCEEDLITYNYKTPQKNPVRAHFTAKTLDNAFSIDIKCSEYVSNASTTAENSAAETDIEISENLTKNLAETIEYDSTKTIRNSSVFTGEDKIVELSAVIANEETSPVNKNVEVASTTKNAELPLSSENVAIPPSSEIIEVSSLSENVEIVPLSENVEIVQPSENVEIPPSSESMEASSPSENVEIPSASEVIRISSSIEDLAMSSTFEKVEISSTFDNEEISSSADNIDSSPVAENRQFSSPDKDRSTADDIRVPRSKDISTENILVDVSKHDIFSQTRELFIKKLQQNKDYSAKGETEKTIFRLISKEYGNDVKKMYEELHKPCSESRLEQRSCQLESDTRYSNVKSDNLRCIQETESYIENSNLNETPPDLTTTFKFLSLACWQLSYVNVCKGFTNEGTKNKDGYKSKKSKKKSQK